MRIKPFWIATTLLLICSSITHGQTLRRHDLGKLQKIGDVKGTGYSDIYDEEFRTLSVHKQSIEATEKYNHLIDEANYQELGMVLNKKRATEPNVLYSTEVRFPTGGTPPDNAVAVSNGNWVVCAINSRLYYYDPDGEMVENPNFKVFVREIPEVFNGSLYDPKVIYDHEADRFILVILHASSPTASRVLVFFSKTNKPTDGWHAYSLPGDAAENNLWFDYPNIAVNKNSVFISGNMFDENDIFNETLIFDIDKNSGYAGKDLEYGFWNALEGVDENAFTIVPVRHGTWTSLPERAYFVSNDGSFGRDLVLFELDPITDELSREQIGIPNFAAPSDCEQNGSDDLLDAGDARIKKAIWINGKIHLVHSTTTSNDYAAVAYHIIDLGDRSVESKVFHKAGERRHITFPSIAAATTDPEDHTVFIAYTETGSDMFPALNAITVDANMTSSPEVTLIEGNGHVDILQDEIERWGDYITVTNNFNANTCWVFGCVGGRQEDYNNYLVEISIDETSSIKDLKPANSKQDIQVYPNPVREKVSVQFELDDRQAISIKLHDINGRLVETFLEDVKKAGIHEFRFNADALAPGQYVISISGANGVLTSKTIVR